MKSTIKSVKELDINALCQGRNFFPSPLSWGDQVIYFLMLDRFSDGQENNYYDSQGNVVRTGKTPLFKPEYQELVIKTRKHRKKWEKSGQKWLGGNLLGLTTKMGYLQRLGITALWISPVFKQVSFEPTYHGYGVQNFLEIDPHFGTKEDFKMMVKTAHDHGIYVLLDILLNHTGNVFTYAEKNTPWFGSYLVKGFNDSRGNPTLPFAKIDLEKYPHAFPDGAVWPAELQNPETFSQKGYIQNWDHYPEYIEGDFLTLKDIHTGTGTIENYHPSSAFLVLCEIYKYWIAYADLDGFRIDTVKHIDPGATRFFVSVIHQFCQQIGKENFYLLGEIAGTRKFAYNLWKETGLNGALGISEIPSLMTELIKGTVVPEQYFSLFRHCLLIQKDSCIWFKNKVVTMFDDHDQIEKGEKKARFCADKVGQKLILNALAFNVTTLGIPCIYYGSEQGFNGSGNHDYFLREAMFGGDFGSFQTTNFHFFNENNYLYQELAKILKIRQEKITLQRGRQYLRPISETGKSFHFPQKKQGFVHSVISWSRRFNQAEIILAMNPDLDHSHTAWVMIDQDLHQEGDRFHCIYSTSLSPIHQEITVAKLAVKCISITVPPAGFVIWEKVV